MFLYYFDQHGRFCKIDNLGNSTIVCESDDVDTDIDDIPELSYKDSPIESFEKLKRLEKRLRRVIKEAEEK